MRRVVIDTDHNDQWQDGELMAVFMDATADWPNEARTDLVKMPLLSVDESRRFLLRHALRRALDALAVAQPEPHKEWRVVDWRGWSPLRYVSGEVAEEGRVRADAEEPDYAPHRVEVRLVGEWEPVKEEA